MSPPCPSHCPFSPLSLSRGSRRGSVMDTHTFRGHWGPFVASHPDSLPAPWAWLQRWGRGAVSGELRRETGKGPPCKVDSSFSHPAHSPAFQAKKVLWGTLGPRSEHALLWPGLVTGHLGPRIRLGCLPTPCACSLVHSSLIHPSPAP